MISLVLICSLIVLSAVLTLLLKKKKKKKFCYFVTYLLSPNQPLNLSKTDENTNSPSQTSFSLPAHLFQLD